jgi:signal transduction histidine kinase
MALDLAAGWLLLAAGVAALGRPARRSFGVVVSLASVAWFVAKWNSPDAGSAWMFTAGLVLSTVCPVLVADAALRYPNRRPGAAPSAAYGCTVFLAGLLPALFFDPAAGGCYGCPANLLLIHDWPRAADDASRAGVYAGVVWVPLLVGALGWRLVRSSGAQRRIAAPVAVPALAYLCVVGRDYLDSLGRGYLGTDAAQRTWWFVDGTLLILFALGTSWSFVWRRRTRSAVARMVVEAAGISTPGGLDRSLGAALGDDSLRVVYPIGDGGWIDGAGRRVDLDDGRGATRLTRGDTTIALLTHRRGTIDEDGVVEEIAGAAGLALDNERLQAQRRAQLAELSASRARIVAAADAERRRLERNLHDGAQQHVVALSLAIRLAQLRADGGEDRLDQAQAEVTAALAGLRILARGLYPRELADEGLPAALETLAEGAAISVAVDAPLDERLPPAVEAAAYFAVAYRLAYADVNQAAVSVRRDGDRLRIEIEDDAPPRDLLAIEDRVLALGGTLTVEPTGKPGTRIRAELPCGS